MKLTRSKLSRTKLLLHSPNDKHFKTCSVILATAEVWLEKQNHGYDCPKCGTVNLQLSRRIITKGGTMITSLFNLKIHVI